MIWKILFTSWWAFNAVVYYRMYEDALAQLGLFRYTLASVVIIILTPFMTLGGYCVHVLSWIMPEDWIENHFEIEQQDKEDKTSKRIEIDSTELPEDIQKFLEELFKDDDDKDE